MCDEGWMRTPCSNSSLASAPLTAKGLPVREAFFVRDEGWMRTPCSNSSLASAPLTAKLLST